RLFLAILSLLLISSCAAFDRDTDAIEGFGRGIDRPGQPSEGKRFGPNSGYYVGTMTLDNNSCESISDEAGVENKLAVKIEDEEGGSFVNATFEGYSRLFSSRLKDRSIVLMSVIMGVQRVYYLTFVEGGIEGSCEVMEADDAGEFGESCATYTIELMRGEEPPADASVPVDEDAI
ncbi:MAG TPA: hypothetical protein PLT05_05855, partial [bacterium]|nr:hypothetical protein [bacterium]